MPKTTPFQELTKDFSSERRARVARLKKQYEEEMVLEQLRQALDYTQARVAKRLGTSQVNVSRLERRTDMLLSTLREYLRAMGGELELRAYLPGLGSVRLKGLGELHAGTRS